MPYGGVSGVESAAKTSGKYLSLGETAVATQAEVQKPLVLLSQHRFELQLWSGDGC